MSYLEDFWDQPGEVVWTLAEKELDYAQGRVLNIGWHCADKQCLRGLGDKVALYHEDMDGKVNTFTFNELRLASNTVGAYLRELGMKDTDRVCLFMDRIPELYASFLGILKIGAVVQPLFSAFGDESLRVRLESAATRAIVTQKKHLHKIRKIRDKLPSLEYVIVVDATEGLRTEDGECPFRLDEVEPVEDLLLFPTTAESPSILHYTSGTTGQPKGVEHVHYSIVSQYLTTKWLLDLKEDDVYWCTADPGWVTGISYGIIGPWSLGVTQCVLEAGFSAPKWYEFLEKNRVTVWYTAPTAIRSLMRAGDELVKEYDLSCLRHLASVGEPLNPEAVIWSGRVLGKTFHDTFWQTETGSIMIANRPGMNIKAGSMGKPFPGITAAVLDATSDNPVAEPGTIGLLAFKPGWPAMMRGYWNNKEKYLEKFRNGWFITGDKARQDADGYFWYVGRDDDVINTGGHLVSPFEVESALLEHPAITESAVVSRPDDLNMEVVKAFIVLKKGVTPDVGLELDIMNFIRKKLSSIAMPQALEYVDALPKTRSGKIMRRLLHAQEWGEPIGDVSSLEDD